MTVAPIKSALTVMKHWLYEYCVPQSRKIPAMPKTMMELEIEILIVMLAMVSMIDGA